MRTFVIIPLQVALMGMVLALFVPLMVAHLLLYELVWKPSIAYMQYADKNFDRLLSYHVERMTK